MYKRFKPLNNETDVKKIEQIYELHSRTMIYTAKQILGDSDLVKDAVSESFAKIINNIDKINDISCYQTRGYIVIIVKSVSLDILKKLKKHETRDVSMDVLNDVPDPSPSAIDEITSYESYEVLVKAIRSLPETFRDPIYLLVFEHLSYHEIADELNISYDAVKMRIFRAKKEIKKSLEESE